MWMLRHNRFRLSKWLNLGVLLLAIPKMGATAVRRTRRFSFWTRQRFKSQTPRPITRWTMSCCLPSHYSTSRVKTKRLSVSPQVSGSLLFSPWALTVMRQGHSNTLKRWIFDEKKRDRPKKAKQHINNRRQWVEIWCHFIQREQR